MLALLVAVVAALRAATRARLELTAEIFALRHQSAVLRQRAPRRLRLGRTDRLVWVLLSRVWSRWRETVQIVSPENRITDDQPDGTDVPLEPVHKWISPPSRLAYRGLEAVNAPDGRRPRRSVTGR